MEKIKVRMRELKGSGYLCPVCKTGELAEIKTEKDFGDVKIKFKTMDGIEFEFRCETKNDFFFLCKNQNCRARFERSKFRKGEKKLGAPCPSINCQGSLNTYKEVPIAKIYPKEGAENIVLSYGKNAPLNFKIVTGLLSYDEAGICTQCHYVGPKEVNLR